MNVSDTDDGLPLDQGTRMAELGMCFYCLTEEHKQVDAVTTRNGTAICEKCANEVHESEQQQYNAIQEGLGSIRLPPNLGS